MKRKAVLINDTSSEGHYGCTRVVDTIRRLAERNGMKIVTTSLVHTRWEENPSILAALAECDIVLVNGEGTIHSDRPAARSLVNVAGYCNSIGKPAVLLNASWFANGAELSSMAKHFAIVSVRESESERQLTAAGVACRRMADLALHDGVAGSVQRKGIGFTDSVLADVAIELHHLRRRNEGVPITIFHGHTGPGGIRFFLRQAGARQAIGQPARFLAAAQAAAISYTSQKATLDLFLASISGLELLVTGRFHAAIFALASETPILAVESNTPKISAALRDAGLPSWRVQRDARFDNCLLRQAAHWSPEEIANIRDYQSDSRSRQEQLFKDIAALAE